MKNFIYTLLAFIVIFTSCQDSINHEIIEQVDIDYIESLKQADKKEEILILDSVIQNSIRNKGITALANLRKGVIFSTLQSDKKSVACLEIALKSFKEYDNKKYIATTYWHLGNSQIYLGNKVLANKQLLTALQYSKEIKDKKLEANIYGSLSHIYFLYKDYNTSIDYTKRTIKTYESLKDTFGLSSSYNNLAVIYKNIKNYESALEYNLKSLKLNILNKDTGSIAKSHNNIGLLITLLNKDKEAISHFLKAAELNKLKEILNSAPLKNLGNLYLKINSFELAKKYYIKALAIENQKYNPDNKIELNNTLSQIFILEKDFENALKHQNERDLSIKRKDKLENQKKLDLVKSQYQFMAKEQELKQKERIDAKNRVIFLIVFGVMLLLVLVLFLYEKNKKLKVEKQKMHLEQKVLRSQMNPHFIFNVLSAIQNSLLDNDSIKSATYLSRFAKLIRQNFDFINHKTIPLVDEVDSLTNYLETQKLRFKEKFDYSFNIDPKINLDLVEIPPLLLQPFVENSIEHGFKKKKEKGFIEISISESEDKMYYSVTDNGSGYNIQEQDEKNHAIDVFKKRMNLYKSEKNKKNFKITSNNEGTIVEFNLRK